MLFDISKYYNIPIKIKKLLDNLIILLSRYESLLISFSGGTDSSFLLMAALQNIPFKKIYVVFCKGLLTPPWEIQQARNLAIFFGVKLLEIDVNELNDPAIVINDYKRCYYCKRRRLISLIHLAHEYGIKIVAEGSHLDDKIDNRPGIQAVIELNVHSPLIKAGLNKKNIRYLSKTFKLVNANVPSSACLATRFPLGTKLNFKTLFRIVKAESSLRRLLPGQQIRIRDYYPIARIEMNPSFFTYFSFPSLRKKIIEITRQAGYNKVYLDLTGYPII